MRVMFPSIRIHRPGRFRAASGTFVQQENVVVSNWEANLLVQRFIPKVPIRVFRTAMGRRMEAIA